MMRSAVLLLAFAVPAAKPTPAPPPPQPVQVIVNTPPPSPPVRDLYDKIQMAIGIAGLVGIVITFASLLYLRGQVNEAKQQRIQSEQTAKRQLRAYLCVDEACVKMKGDTVADIESNDNLHVMLEGQLHIKNVGQTPAYNVRSWMHGSIRTYPEDKPVPPPPEGLPRSTEIIASQGKRIYVAKETYEPQDILKRLRTQPIAYIVQGEVRYQDVFKDWHVLKVRYMMGGPSGVRTGKDAKGVPIGLVAPDQWGNTDEDVDSEEGAI